MKVDFKPEIKERREETTEQGVQLIFTRKTSKHDEKQVKRFNAMIVDGRITFGPNQNKEREAFQKILDENGLVFNDFRIVPIDKPKLPEEVIYKELKFTSDKEVIEEIQKIQDNVEDDYKLAKLINLSKYCNYTMCLKLPNMARIRLEEALSKETDKVIRREINQSIRKTTKSIQYCIRDGYYLQMNPTESNDSAAKRLYDQICAGTAKTLED